MAGETDLTEAQWTVLSSLMPPPRKRGRPRSDDRKTLDGILYVLRTGSLVGPSVAIRESHDVLASIEIVERRWNMDQDLGRSPHDPR